MYGTYIADECPRCGSRQMPPLTPGSLATARACQRCGWVEELDPKSGKPVLLTCSMCGDPYQARYPLGFMCGKCMGEVAVLYSGLADVQTNTPAGPAPAAKVEE